MKRIDISGNKFNKLTAIMFLRYFKKRTMWLFKCDCGKEKEIEQYSVTSGNTKSCGCFFKNRNTKHLMSKSSEYKSWVSMKERCLNKKSKAYKNYGGRGIKISKRWLLFENFFLDMGKKPSAKHSIDRINNNNGYTKTNCKWSTVSEQNSNQRIRSTSKTKEKYISIEVSKKGKTKYKARPFLNGSRKTIGRYDSINDAKKAIKEYLCQNKNS